MASLPTETRERYRAALAVANAEHRRRWESAKQLRSDGADTAAGYEEEASIKFGAVAETLEWCLNDQKGGGLIISMLRADAYRKANPT